MHAGPAAAQFAARTDLVHVYATVTDEAGRPLDGLRRDEFVVEEDGVPQPVETFATGETPLALAVAVDRSFSMPEPVLKALRTGVGRLTGLLVSSDQLMLIAIGGETEVLVPLGTARGPVDAAVNRLERWGTTPLYDSVMEAVAAVQPAAGRRALILLSDGVDRYSKASASEVVAYAREHDVMVYPVSIGRERPAIWSEVASVSGGRSFHVRDVDAVASTLAEIVAELRRQYLLGYRLPDGPAGWRSIRVRVTRAGARVRARDGYRADAR